MIVRHMRRVGCIALITLGLVLGQGAAGATTTLSDPAEPGPYPVGVTTHLFEDHARTNDATGAPRPLLTEIWYPATDETRDLPKNRLLDFYAKGQVNEIAALMKVAFGVDLFEADKTFHNVAVRDARVRDGLFPLIVFSHGNGGMRSQGAFWCDQMASHGYIVMAPDHTGNCLVTAIDGNLVVFDGSQEGRSQSATDRPKDVSFLIDTMERINKGADGRFAGKVDLEHIGVAGHSFGGFTSTWVADTDPRVDAIIPMAGVGRTRVKYDCPVLIVMATEDDTLGLDGNDRVRKYYEESTGPRYFVEFLNAGHYSFTEMFQYNPEFGDGAGAGTRITNGEPITYVPMDVVFPLTNGYSTAFFGRYLKGLTGYDDYLVTNHLPKELVVKSSVPETP